MLKVREGSFKGDLKGNIFNPKIVHICIELPEEAMQVDTIIILKIHSDEYMDRKCFEGCGSNAG